MNRDEHSDFFKVLPDTGLPIFSGKSEDLTLFYAPGFLAAATEKEAEEIRQILLGEYPFGNLIAGDLINAAAEAQAVWAYDHSPDHYEPTCLTIYSSLACNLNCSYCFASRAHELLELDEKIIFENAGRVLANCRAKEMPFTAVFHGGGEPSLDPRLSRILSEIRRMSEQAEVPFRSYMATNGVMDEKKAVWIAENINMLGLSVDGPPDIQNQQRPLRSGGKTAPIVERTAAVFKKIKGYLSVRVTILPENYSRMEEIADYCGETLGADEIHIEPVYSRGEGPDGDLAHKFCENYLKVKEALKKKGIKLTFSGSRIAEIHGRYCQIYRQVLHLVPPDACSACFALSSREETEQNGLLLRPDEFGAVFERLAAEDPACLNCFNRYHCARGCPDVCPALPGGLHDAGSFRCRVSRILAEEELLAAARSSLFGPARRYGSAGIDLRGE